MVPERQFLLQPQLMLKKLRNEKLFSALFVISLCGTIFRQTVYLTPENSAEFGLKVVGNANRNMASKGKIFGLENRNKSSQIIIDDNFYTPF
jgi:hypothetical protein